MTLKSFERVIGLHLNMITVPTGKATLGLMLGSFWPSLLVPADKTGLVFPLGQKFIHILQETGYLHLQATKPDTIGNDPNVCYAPGQNFLK